MKKYVCELCHEDILRLLNVMLHIIYMFIVDVLIACRIGDSHRSEFEELYHLGYNTI
jgi:hypothetical protein